MYDIIVVKLELDTYQHTTMKPGFREVGYYKTLLCYNKVILLVPALYKSLFLPW